MRNEIKVSVILPVYNAGHRLKKCIESILSQNLKEIEVICILDCPTDGSDKVIESYAQKDKRIVVVKNNRNLNIGESRNVGIQLAKGEYLAFSDHDDITLPEMYENMYNIGVKENADMVLGVPEYTYLNPSENQTYFYPKEGDIREDILKCVIGRGKEDSDEWSFYFSHGVIWDKLYKRSLIADNNIKFVDNNKITFEDNLFIIETTLSANKAIAYNHKVYQHTIEASNTASSAGYTKKERIAAYVEYLHSVLLAHHVSDDFKQRFANSSVRYFIGCLTRVLLTKKNIPALIDVYKYVRKQSLKKYVFSLADYNTFIKESKTLSKKFIYTFFYYILKLG